eukprot:scaffold3096_cov403-Prasinococcus_capsulatus_cf.AAC.13
MSPPLVKRDWEVSPRGLCPAEDLSHPLQFICRLGLTSGDVEALRTCVRRPDDVAERTGRFREVQGNYTLSRSREVRATMQVQHIAAVNGDAYCPPPRQGGPSRLVQLITWLAWNVVLAGFAH